jgi:hypothetical protein
MTSARRCGALERRPREFLYQRKHPEAEALRWMDEVGLAS